jgi:four helix bundle protein
MDVTNSLENGAGRRELKERNKEDWMNEKQFRFQNLEIWKRAAAQSNALFARADKLEHRHLYRFAEQLRAATLSITNNIAEGSGSVSKPDFANFLNMARRSVFEVANLLTILSLNNYMEPTEVQPLIDELEQQSRMILAFIRTLKS